MSISLSVCLVFLVFIVSSNCDLLGPQINLPKPSVAKLPPCRLCKLLVESFEKGIERTARGKHEGGDAAWEEEKLRSYKTSEIRLVEIQDHLCKELKKYDDQCHSLAEDVETFIEDWWFKHQTDSPDLYTWLCIEKTEVCCPANHYGANCDLCSDCHGNGICKGNGTRKGNGKCQCDIGYRGEACLECDLNYYESFRDDEKLLCSKCHVACDEGGCTSAGPKGCRVCRNGWVMEQEIGGCLDVDECASTKNVCTTNQFCVNSEGSYKCLECDKSCNGCIGDGPDLCNECIDGYELRDGLCTANNRLNLDDDDEDEEEGDAEPEEIELNDKNDSETINLNNKKIHDKLEL